jgi:hypothetical protein
MRFTSALFIIGLLVSCGGFASDKDDTGSEDTAKEDTGTEDTGTEDTGVPLSDVCIFGDFGSDIHASALLEVRLVANYSEASELPAMVEQQFIAAMIEEDLAVIENAEDGFVFVDDNITHYELTTLYNGTKTTWLHWWSGDTEVGYLFADGTTEIVAVVSDGDIYECTVMAPL